MALRRVTKEQRAEIALRLAKRDAAKLAPRDRAVLAEAQRSAQLRAARRDAARRLATVNRETTEEAMDRAADERSEAARAMNAAMTPEQRSAAARAGGRAAQAAMTPEQRSANGRAGGRAANASHSRWAGFIP